MFYAHAHVGKDGIACCEPLQLRAGQLTYHLTLAKQRSHLLERVFASQHSGLAMHAQRI